MSSGPWTEYQTPDAPSAPAAAPAEKGPWTQYQNAKPQVSAGEDIARQAPGSLYKGAMDVAGAPADIMNLADSAWQWLVSKGLEKTGVWTPEQATAARQPIPGLEDRSTRGGFPTSQLLTDATEKAAGKFYEPQTTEGQWAGVVTRALPSIATAPGSLIQRGVQTVVPAIASEGAGQIAHEYAPDYETAARIAGGVATGAAVAGAQAPRGANVVAQDALRGVTQPELEAAFRLIDQSANLPGGGVTLTLNDALGQVTNGRTTRLQQLDGTVTNSGGPGAERMAQVYSARPGEIQRTGEAAVESIAPNPYPAEQTARRGQEAAEGVIQQTQTGINAMTRPAYQAAQGATLDPAAFAALQADPLYARTLQQVRADPALNRTIAGMPDDAVGVVDIVQRQMRQQAENLATPGQAHTNNLAAGNYQDARTGAIGAAEAATGGPQGAYARARDVQTRLRETQLQPLTDGPVGRISRMDPAAEGASADMGRQLAAPDSYRNDGVVQQSVRRMVRQDPRAAETLARDYVGDVLNKSLTANQGGPNVMAGANFFKQIAGDPASMRNLEAMVTQLPDGQNRWGGFQTFLETMQATGYKAAKGSDTAFKLGIKEELSRPGIAGTVVQGAGGAIAGTAVGGAGGSVAGTAAGLKKALDARLDSWRLSNGGEQVARMLTDPQMRPLLRQLSNVPPGSNQAIGLSLRLSYIAEKAAGQSGADAEAAPIVEPR